jgi:hypothetical protein
VVAFKYGNRQNARRASNRAASGERSNHGSGEHGAWSRKTSRSAAELDVRSQTPRKTAGEQEQAKGQLGPWWPDSRLRPLQRFCRRQMLEEHRHFPTTRSVRKNVNPEWIDRAPCTPHRVEANCGYESFFMYPTKRTVRLAGENFTRQYPASDLSANDTRRTRTSHAADAERDSRGSGCGPSPA